PRTEHTFLASSFINDNEGWLADSWSTLWHTSNGCATVDSISTGIHFKKLDFTTSLIGYGLDLTNAYKTIDGGATWSTLTLPSTIQQAIYFLNKDTGFISGYNQ